MGLAYHLLQSIRVSLFESEIVRAVVVVVPVFISYIGHKR